MYLITPGGGWYRCGSGHGLSRYVVNAMLTGGGQAAGVTLTVTLWAQSPVLTVTLWAQSRGLTVTPFGHSLVG